MGVYHSTRRSHGTLRGATLPPCRDVLVPPLKSSLTKYRILIPSGKRPGDIVSISIAGEDYKAKVPWDQDRSEEDLKEGTFTVVLKAKEAELAQIIASTLPFVPGMEIVESKPIVWGSVSYAFQTSGHDQQSMGNMVGTLMKDAQTQVMEQTREVSCNAVLGLTFNVTNDSGGKWGSQKLVVVTAFGTPCNVIQNSNIPPKTTAFLSLTEDSVVTG